MPSNNVRRFLSVNLKFFKDRIQGNINRKCYNPLVYIKREKFNNLLARLKDNIYQKIGELNAKVYVTKEPVAYEDRKKGRPMEIALNEKWGDLFDCGWFHFTGKIPEEHKGKNLVVLLDIAGEGLVVDKEGEPAIAITSYASEYDYNLGLPVKKVVPIDSNEDISLWVDGACNDLFGKFINSGSLVEKDIAIENVNIKNLYYDLEVLLSIYDSNKDAETAKIMGAVESIVPMLKVINEENAINARKALEPFMNKKNSEENTFTYYAIGHAHLDLAWLWPIRETLRKGARTFSTQLYNINKYDGYLFGASQAQLYDWMDKLYPKLFKRVDEAIKQGTWEVQGATWVEPDTNLIGAESLIRQFVYGIGYHREKFNLDMEMFFVPDSFGYTACLPQVMKQCGVKYFLTQKMSWNTVNKFPHHTFYWTGLDGSRVLAHMLPEETYNSPMRADKLKFGYDNFKEKEFSNKAMNLYGIGDGGAGPSEEHIERALRFNDIEGMPKVEMKYAIDLFKDIDTKEEYPEYKGELYLERHRGTYTTQAKSKWYNRKIELLLREYELLYTKLGKKAPIQQAELDEMWKEALLYQFHDILPGSSIKRVYDESLIGYQLIWEKLTQALKEGYSALYKDSFYVNSLSWDRDITYKNEEKWYKLNVPAMSVASISKAQEIEGTTINVCDTHLENEFIKVELENGLIKSFYDKVNECEYIESGELANRFSVYNDKGDAWDIQPWDYRMDVDQPKLMDISSQCDGAMGIIKLSYAYNDSVINQEITLKSGENRVEFNTNVVFKETNKMLRVAFPLAINSEECAFNLQFGHIKRRTTHANSFETAQFEVSGQKFVDLSDENRGITLINDCKYGFKCWDNVIDMNLIRTPMYPGIDADKGEHNIKYALYPHNGGLDSRVYRQAYEFNIEPLFVEGKGKKSPNTDKPIIAVDNPNIIVECIKPAYDGEGVVVRLYNCSESKEKFTISCENESVSTVNPLEEFIKKDTGKKYSLKAFEILSLKLN